MREMLWKFVLKVCCEKMLCNNGCKNIVSICLDKVMWKFIVKNYVKKVQQLLSNSRWENIYCWILFEQMLWKSFREKAILKKWCEQSGVKISWNLLWTIVMNMMQDSLQQEWFATIVVKNNVKHGCEKCCENVVAKKPWREQSLM